MRGLGRLLSLIGEEGRERVGVVGGEVDAVEGDEDEDAVETELDDDEGGVGDEDRALVEDVGALAVPALVPRLVLALLEICRTKSSLTTRHRSASLLPVFC